jgi:mRNA interferase YafQ
VKYVVKPTSQFKRDLKGAKKRGYNIDLITDVIKKLAQGEELPPENKEHQLSGKLAKYRECHITPDWLLMYEIDDIYLYLYLARTGTHSDLF